MDATERYRHAERALWQRYGLDARERFVELNDPALRLRVVEVGSGRPVLFIPGTGGTGPYWAPLVSELSDVRCLAIDRPGWGLSSPMDYTRDTFGSLAATTLVKVLDALELDRVDVVGASIGGLWALHLARRDPSRVGRVVLLGGMPHREIGVPRFIKVLSSPLGAIMVRVPMSPRMLRSQLEAVGHGPSVAAGRMDDFIAWRLSFSNDTPSMRHERAMARALRAGAAWRPGFTMEADDLAEVPHPVRMIFGSGDPTGTPELWQRFMAQLPNGELVLVPGAGHQPWWDEPAEVGSQVHSFLMRRSEPFRDTIRGIQRPERAHEPTAMTDGGRQDAADGRPELARLTLIAFAAVILLGGLNGIAGKQILHELEPFWSGVIRFGIAGLIMLAVVVATRRALPRGRSLLGAMAYGALGFGVTFGLFFTGLRDTPISTAAVFLALTPLMTFGLAIAHGQERFRLQGLVGALVALVGVALIFADQLSADIPLGSLVLLLLGALCLAETGVIVKLIPRSDPVGTNAVGMLTGCAVLLLLSLVTAEPRGVPTTPITWAALAYLVTLGSVVLFGLFVYILERWTASAVSYSDLLIPVVTIAIATLLTGERFTPWFLLGGGVVLAGVYIGSFLHLPRRRTPASVPECLPLEEGATAAQPP